MLPGDVGAEVGGVGAPSAGGSRGEESSTANFAGGEVGVREGASTVGVCEEERVGVGEVRRGRAVVLVDVIVGDVGPGEVVG